MTKLYAGYETQAELDLQYDPTRGVPDFGIYVERFLSQSAAARDRLEHRAAVPYGPSKSEHVNIFLPKAPPATGAPIFVFIHGGYWVAFEADAFDLVAPGPVEAGFAVVNITYALCPGVTISEIVRQVRAAIVWTYRNAASFGGDPAQIFLAGHSAGGHLTGMAMATDWSGVFGIPDDVIKGAMPISGLMDLYPLSCSWLQPMVRFSSGEILRESPIHHIRPSQAPLVAAWGGAETSEFERQSRDYLTAWQGVGNRGEALAIPAANHFEVLDGFATVDGLMTTKLVGLMQDSQTRR